MGYLSELLVLRAMGGAGLRASRYVRQIRSWESIERRGQGGDGRRGLGP